MLRRKLRAAVLVDYEYLFIVFIAVILRWMFERAKGIKDDDRDFEKEQGTLQSNLNVFMPITHGCKMDQSTTLKIQTEKFCQSQNLSRISKCRTEEKWYKVTSKEGNPARNV